MDFTQIVIFIVFFLLDKGHKAENLQKEFFLNCKMFHFCAKVLEKKSRKLNLEKNKWNAKFKVIYLRNWLSKGLATIGGTIAPSPVEKVEELSLRDTFTT